MHVLYSTLGHANLDTNSLAVYFTIIIFHYRMIYIRRMHVKVDHLGSIKACTHPSQYQLVVAFLDRQETCLNYFQFYLQVL